MDTNKVIERVYLHLEEGHVDKATMACLRISRHLSDHLSAALFLREIHGSKKDAMIALYHDVSHLNQDAQRYIWEKSGKDWLEGRTLPYAIDKREDGEELNVYALGVGAIDAELVQLERSIQDMALPETLGEYDSAAFTDRYNYIKINLRNKITAIRTVKERIRARCLNYAIRIEKQLSAQQRSRNYLESVQNDVNNFFKARSEDVYKKLQNATQLIDTTDSENLANLLTQVRRAVKATADYFYPPLTSKVKCHDGIERNLGEDRYLNRLHEFLMTKVQRSTSGDLLQAEFETLAVFVRRLNDVASKGVHSDVSMREAKQGLLGLYLFLANLCSHLEQD